MPRDQGREPRLTVHTPRPDLAHSRELLAQLFEFAPDAKLLIDGDGRIVMANALTETLLGYTRDELIGEPVEVLIPARFMGKHVEHRSGYMAAPRTRPMGASIELFARRKDGTELPVDILLSPIDTEHGVFALAVVRDITERKAAESQARQVREIYLKELHHRVKNNLQVISSLLFLQSSQTSDPATRRTLEESQSRVKSMALIHEKLYRSPGLTRIDFAEYVRDLATDLCRTYSGGQDSVAVRVEVAPIWLEIDTAIPCGLIINELVSNALKHAFPEGRKGVVAIDLSQVGAKEYLLVVKDDGVGLPKDYNWRTGRSLGLNLVSDLTHQLDGEVNVESGSGATFRVSFREVQYTERG